MLRIKEELQPRLLSLPPAPFTGTAPPRPASSTRLAQPPSSNSAEAAPSFSGPHPPPRAGSPQIQELGLCPHLWPSSQLLSPKHHRILELKLSFCTRATQPRRSRGAEALGAWEAGGGLEEELKPSFLCREEEEEAEGGGG